jgi:hypothetical protein
MRRLDRHRVAAAAGSRSCILRDRPMGVRMLLATGVGSIVAPSPMLVLWTLLVLGAVCGAVVTAAKGRTGWFFVGLVTGVTFLFSAFLPAAPGSPWAKRAARRRVEAP